MIKLLKDICNNLSNIPDINEGGCGIVAYEFSKVFQKVGMPHEIKMGCFKDRDTTLSDNPVGFLNASYLVTKSELASQNIYLDHIGIKLSHNNQYYWVDASGVTKYRPTNFYCDGYALREYEGALKGSALKMLIDNKSLWNSTFNRLNKKIIKVEIQRLTVEVDALQI